MTELEETKQTLELERRQHAITREDLRDAHDMLQKYPDKIRLADALLKRQGRINELERELKEALAAFAGSEERVSNLEFAIRRVAARERSIQIILSDALKK